MFSKIDKKILIVSLIILCSILLGGFLIYKLTIEFPVSVKNSEEGVQAEQNVSPQDSVEIVAPKVQINNNNAGEIQGLNGDNGFSICLDKCGDGVCQKSDDTCEKDKNLNCICAETPQECPQDCK